MFITNPSFKFNAITPSLEFLINFTNSKSVFIVSPLKFLIIGFLKFKKHLYNLPPAYLLEYEVASLMSSVKKKPNFADFAFVDAPLYFLLNLSNVSEEP